MANNNLNEQYYRILKINPGCSWDELRRAYKKQIQSWHPDRFAANASKEQTGAAEEKIKTINMAFNFLSGYYHEHGNLPSVEKESPSVNNPQSVPATDTREDEPDEQYRESLQEAGASERGNRSFSFYFFITAALLSIYLMANYEDEQVKAPQEKSAGKHTESTDSNTGSENNLHEAITTTSNAEDDKAFLENINIKYRYFTFGSTMSEVINAQGKPTRIDGDTWYYGNAMVYFKDGVVVDWKRDSDTPLNIKISIK